MTKPRKAVCKAVARNIAAALVENFEVIWQQENYKISYEEVALVEAEMRNIATKIARTINFDLLDIIEREK